MRWLPAPSRPAARPEEVHIWRAWLDRDGWPEESALPAPERRRAAAIQIPGRRRRWVAARWALRTTLARYNGGDPVEQPLEIDPGGKPRVGDGTGLRFNLSHSGEIALVAVTEGREVGIDVERIKADRPRSFYSEWVRREAVAKCTGAGLAAPVPEETTWVSDLDPGRGWVAAIALSSSVAVRLRLFEHAPRASPGRR